MTQESNWDISGDKSQIIGFRLSRMSASGKMQGARLCTHSLIAVQLAGYSWQATVGNQVKDILKQVTPEAIVALRRLLLLPIDCLSDQAVKVV